MRFCIVTPFVGHNDGQGRVNFEIAAEATRQGHEVVLITEQVGGLSGALSQRVIVLPPPAWLPTRLLRDQLFAWRTCAALAREAEDCDAVLANGFVSWARCDFNAVHFVHDSWARSEHHPWRLRRTARSLYARMYTSLNVILERVAFRRSSRLIAVSGSVARDLSRIGVPADRISVILNGVDTNEFHPGPADRRKAGVPETVPLALFAGDLKSPRKNLKTVLRALAAVPGLHLAIAGREADTPYPALARDLGIADRVHFLGFRRDMPDLMRAADLFVFPSRYEACSLVLLEALASGLPVVTARSAGGSELIGPEVGLVLEDADDVDSLALAMRTLVADADHRHTMGRSARALAERHTWVSMARCYVQMLTVSAEHTSKVRHLA